MSISHIPAGIAPIASIPKDVQLAVVEQSTCLASGHEDAGGRSREHAGRWVATVMYAASHLYPTKVAAPAITSC